MRRPTADAHVRATLLGMERVLEYAVAVFLSIFGILSLGVAILTVRDSLRESPDYTYALTQGLDAVLLTVILLELLKTVLSRAPLARRVQEFLIIGVFSSVRYGLEVVAGARVSDTRHGPSRDPHDVAVTLAINAVVVVLLIGALWLARRGEVDDVAQTNGHGV